MWGSSGVASDNLQDSNHRRLGASAEGRLAWPQASSPSGHLCKPTRPQDPRVAFRRAPYLLLQRGGDFRDSGEAVFVGGFF